MNSGTGFRAQRKNMKVLKLRYALSLCLLTTYSCKSYHPTPGLRDSFKKGNSGLDPVIVPDPNKDHPSPTPDPGPENALIIKKLNLPTEVARYNRSCLIIQTESKADVVIKSYKLDQAIEIEPTLDYKITLEIYNDDALRYSNAYCPSNQSFNAEVGRNIFTVPVCAPSTPDAVPSEACRP
jgi:hypothetical protein